MLRLPFHWFYPRGSFETSQFQYGFEVSPRLVSTQERFETRHFKIENTVPVYFLIVITISIVPV